MLNQTSEASQPAPPPPAPPVPVVVRPRLKANYPLSPHTHTCPVRVHIHHYCRRCVPVFGFRPHCYCPLNINRASIATPSEPSSAASGFFLLHLTRANSYSRITIISQCFKGSNALILITPPASLPVCSTAHPEDPLLTDRCIIPASPGQIYRLQQQLSFLACFCMGQALRNFSSCFSGLESSSFIVELESFLGVLGGLSHLMLVAGWHISPLPFHRRLLSTW